MFGIVKIRRGEQSSNDRNICVLRHDVRWFRHIDWIMFPFEWNMIEIWETTFSYGHCCRWICRYRRVFILEDIIKGVVGYVALAIHVLNSMPQTTHIYLLIPLLFLWMKVKFKMKIMKVTLNSPTIPQSLKSIDLSLFMVMPILKTKIQFKHWCYIWKPSTSSI